MTGKRVYVDSDGDFSLRHGEYGKHPKDGNWYCRPPGSHMGNLSNHEVVEHEDGTITVSPSILVTGYDGQWHGYLKKGVWEEC